MFCTSPLPNIVKLNSSKLDVWVPSDHIFVRFNKRGNNGVATKQLLIHFSPTFNKLVAKRLVI